MKHSTFIDRQPHQSPILCKDGKLRHPYFVRPNQIMRDHERPQAIKGYKAFIA